jgi:hypothetical protein
LGSNSTFCSDKKSIAAQQDAVIKGQISPLERRHSINSENAVTHRPARSVASEARAQRQTVHGDGQLQAGHEMSLFRK